MDDWFGRSPPHPGPLPEEREQKTGESHGRQANFSTNIFGGVRCRGRIGGDRAEHIFGAVQTQGQKSLRRAAIDGKTVAIVRDPADAVANATSANWSLDQVRDALRGRNIAVRNCEKIADTKPTEFCIIAASSKSPWLRQVLEQFSEPSSLRRGQGEGAGNSSGTLTPALSPRARELLLLPDVPETLGLASAGVADRSALVACGTDARGLGYALLDVADRILRTDPPLAALQTVRPTVETAANRIRSVARLFASDIEDKPWFRDKAFWKDYLTMLARERFNRFNLTLGLGYDFARQVRDAYFYFAYPFFLAVPNYDVRAVGLSDGERDENLTLLKFISDEAARRGARFSIGHLDAHLSLDRQPRREFYDRRAQCRQSRTVLPRCTDGALESLPID